MRTKVKAFIVVVGALLVVTAISLIIFSRGPLYGKAAKDNWVPDMIGVWRTSEGAAYFYEDVTDPMCMPVYTGAPHAPEDYFHITHQTGRAFAGTFGEGSKLAGVILSDRTVSIQFFEPSEWRCFFTGRMIKRKRGALQISGYVHIFDDFGIRIDMDKNMASGYGRFVKVD